MHSRPMFMKSVLILILFSFFNLANAQDRSAEKSDEITDKTIIHIEGSTTVEPVMTGFAEYFMNNNAGTSVTVSAYGSSLGAKALATGDCDLEMMSRPMKIQEYRMCVEKLVFPMAHAVAMDALIIVVHPSNPVENLTLEQVRQIFSGRINSWQEVGGENKSIVRLGRDMSSGAYGSFFDIVMGNLDMAPDIETCSNLYNALRSTPESIGYLGTLFFENVKQIRIDGIKPNRENIAKGIFPISRPLFVYTDGYPKVGSQLHRFISLIAKERGEELIMEQAYIPLTYYGGRGEKVQPATK